ncbi:MAG TPA: GNAT family protein [Dehalococcoidia bacterium]|jgi:RimJ/RimL family protein N-acetyltransferase
MIAPDSTLEGTLVRLRPVEERDLPLFVQWLNDPDVRHWQGRSERGPETMETQRERLEHNRNDPEHCGWLIETLDGKPLGNVGVRYVEKLHGSAELYIFIGDKARWSGGYGTDAIRTLLRHAFGELGQRRVYLVTDADNERGIRCYEKCGFVREGLLRAHRVRYGEPLDMVMMGVLREEWEG